MTPPPPPQTVLAVDPGSAKCGLAVVSAAPFAGGSPVCCLHRAVVESERLIVEVAETLRRFPAVTLMLMGGGTGSARLRRALQAAFPQFPLKIVDEHGSSARARQRFVTEIPAPGWRRLLPRGLRAPERPYDDFVAQLLAEEYLLGQSGTNVEK